MTTTELCWKRHSFPRLRRRRLFAPISSGGIVCCVSRLSDFLRRPVFYFVKATGAEPVPVFTGEFPSMLRHWTWKYTKYSLRPLPCLNKNSLRKNCFAHFSEQDSGDFWRGGRSLADARRGQQGKKRRIKPLKCGTGSVPAALSRKRTSGASTVSKYERKSAAVSVSLPR